jgi:XisI protein
MDKLTKYKQLIVNVLESYIASDMMNPDEELYLVKDEIKMHYLLYKIAKACLFIQKSNF